ncbi:MAG: DUF4214 domain-containing protein [Desulfobulbaceae bacterium]|nr:DUF4214 domain-containing protein [Desulfobulbaceae bacterium]
MAIDTPLELISQLYIAYFDRGGDPDGMTYWISLFNTGQLDLTAIAENFAMDTEARTLYPFLVSPGSISSSDFITDIYSNLFNRQPDAEGLAYWIAQLSSGATSPGKMIIDIIYGAAANDAELAQSDYATVENKVATAVYYTEEFAQSNITWSVAAHLDGARSILIGVNSDASSVESAKTVVDEIIAGSTSGNTYSLILTSGIDMVTGTSDSDTILALDTTFNRGDSINGSSGDDALTLIMLSAETDAVSLRSVETVTLRNGAAATNIDAVNWRDVETLEFDSCTAATSVRNITSQLALALQDNTTDVSATYSAGALTAGTAQQIVTENSNCRVKIAGASGEKISSLSISASGTNTLTLYDDDADLQSVTISGSGDLTILAAAENTNELTNVSNVSASSSSGNLTIDLSGATLAGSVDSKLNIATGSGNDTITIAPVDNIVVAGAGNDMIIVDADFDANDSINGGAGTDTLSLTSALFASVANDDALLDVITNIEKLAIRDELSTGAAVDISVYGMSSLIIQQGISGAQEAKGFSSGATVEIQTHASETDTLTVTMTGATNAGSSTDTLNIVFNTDLEADDDILETALHVAGINILNVSTSDLSTEGESSEDNTLPDSSVGYKLTLTGDGNVSTINVTGSQAFTYIAGAQANIAVISATNMTGNMSVDLATTFAGTQGVTASLGDGDDTITATLFGDIISAGAGDDTINLTKGSDLISCGSGKDTISLVADSTSVTATGITRISDFSAVASTGNADIIQSVSGKVTTDAAGVDVATAEAGGGTAMTITADVVDGIITLAGDDAAQIDTLTEWINVALLVSENGGSSAFLFNDNTYFLEEASSGGAVGNIVELTDLINIVGLATAAAADMIVVG